LWYFFIKGGVIRSRKVNSSSFIASSVHSFLNWQYGQCLLKSIYLPT